MVIQALTTQMYTYKIMTRKESVILTMYVRKKFECTTDISMSLIESRMNGLRSNRINLASQR